VDQPPAQARVDPAKITVIVVEIEGDKVERTR
jgi:hypothetical protein